MKKLAVILAISALTGFGASMAMAGSNPATGVNGSPHDMTKKFPGTADVMGRVCIYCHTPHNATQDDTGLNTYPLWNHTLPTTTGWKNYVWATPLNSTIDTSDPLQGPSRLCMSCHDGVTAPDQHGGAIAQSGSGPLTGSKAVGLNGSTGASYDLTDDHPIGFSWNAAMAARNIAGVTQEIVPKTATFIPDAQDVESTYNAAAGTYAITDSFRTGGKRKIGDVLYQGDVMTCASCHDVHNKDNSVITATNGVQYNYFLWADQKDSKICLSCHIK